MDTRANTLARMLDARARRMEREAKAVRTLAAQLRDTITPDTTASEDTADGTSQERQ